MDEIDEIEEKAAQKQAFYKEIITTLKQKNISKEQIAQLKVKLCKKHKLKNIPTDIEILLHAEPKDIPKLKLLQTKPTRSISGVSVCAVMTKPARCPHGRCTYCPGGLDSYYGDVPQSYTGKEPATRRAIRNQYNPYLQVFNRLEQYIVLGHSTDKVELIIMGGTFPAAEQEYQDYFVKSCLLAMNHFGKLFFKNNVFNHMKFKEFFELPGNIGDEGRIQRIQQKLILMQEKDLKKSLEQIQKDNETSNVRCVAMCIETKPDWALEPHIEQMLRLGTTRVEVGIQTLKDDVLKAVHRGHDLKTSIRSIQLMKDAFLKVGYHMMPGLPDTTKEEDIEMLKELFTNEDYKPDALKIYPCMVMPGTALYRQYKLGKYKPLSTSDAAEIIAESFRFVPEYCRIMRVQRDIPTYQTEAGVDKTNLRQYIDKVMKEKGIVLRDIRARESGHRRNKEGINPENIEIITREYAASGGKEYFISAEDVKNDILVGFCRLRIPSKPFIKGITKDSAGIRELHVFGGAVSLGKKDSHSKSTQHHGWGKQLLKKAEEIAKKNTIKKLHIISGIGAREYYKKLGYKKDGYYMVKRLRRLMR